MTPTVGRIVHYQSYGTPGGEYLPAPRAAIITEVYAYPPRSGEPNRDPDTVALCVLNPAGMFFNAEVKHAKEDAPTPGRWNWPPKV